MIRTTFLFLPFLLLLSAALSAQSTATFKKQRTDTLDGGFFCLDQTPDGVLWVGGIASNGDLMRFQEDGSPLQSMRFKNVGNYRPSWVWDIEAAQDNGGWALLSLYASTGQIQQHALQLIRFDQAGQLRWQRTLNSEQLAWGAFDNHLSTDLSDNAYSTSRSNSVAQTASFQVDKTGPAGDPIWSKVYPVVQAGAFFIFHTTCLADGSLLVGGYIGANPSDETSFLLNIGPDGQVLWGKSYRDFYLRNFVQLPSDDLLLTGDGKGRSMLVRTDPAGSVRWGKSWVPASSIGVISTVAQSKDGNLLIMDGCGADVVCVSPEGDFLWAKNYDPCRKAVITDGIGTRDGGIAFLESERRFIKTDAAGDIAGCATFDVKLDILPQNVTYASLSASPVDQAWPAQLMLETEAYTITVADFCHDTLPVFSIAQSADTVCAGEPLRVSAVSGSLADAYQWTFAGGQPASSMARADSAVFSQSGTQLLTLEVAYGRCLDTLQSAVTVAPFVTNLDLGPDTLLCGTAATLTLDATAMHTGSGSLTYFWENGSTAPLRTVAQSGTYRVTVMRGECTDADTVWVTFAAAPPMLPSDTLLCVGQPLTLSAGGGTGGELFWNGLPGSGDWVTADSGWVHRLLRYGTGCAFMDSVLVRRSDCDDKFEYYAPNVFWPEAETAANTLFRIFPADATLLLLRVYDRWGSLIYESSASDAAWDGLISGQLAMPGVYIWQASLQKPLGQKKHLSGTVTLLR